MPRRDVHSLKQNKAAQRREPHPHKAQAATLRTIGILMMVVGPIAGIGLGAVNFLLGIVFWGGMSAGAAALLKRSKRLKAIGVDEKLARDPRQPVLYLRSFGADERAAENVGQVLSIRGVDLTTPKTEEEQVEMVARLIGPMVAIGRPSEKLPEIGAARMYLAQDQWQGMVASLMERSQLVIMRAGKTEGFWWEVEHAIKLVRPERLFWLIPYSKDNYRQFAQRANLWLPKPLPVDPGGMTRQVGSLKGWIWFECDWTPHFEMPGKRDEASFGLPVAALMHQALAPTLRRLGCARSSIRCAGGKRIVAFAVDLALVFGIGSALVGLAQILHANWLGIVASLAMLAYPLIMDLPQVGGSVGKRITKLRIVTADGVQPSIGQATARNILKVTLIPMTWLYAIVSMGWSLRRILPHDLITRTYVIASDAA